MTQKYSLWFSLVFILFHLPVLYGQNNYTLQGVISDASNGEPMIGATVIVKALNTGITSNNYGFYKSMLEQADQNEYYGELENGDPSFLFRSLPPQLTSNIRNTELPNELVLGNFGVFSNSFYHP